MEQEVLDFVIDATGDASLAATPEEEKNTARKCLKGR